MAGKYLTLQPTEANFVKTQAERQALTKAGKSLDKFWDDYSLAYKTAYLKWNDALYLSEQHAKNQATEELNKRRLANMKTYTSFSGTDIVASIRPYGGKPIIFGEIQTISYSIHRQMSPVYSLGRINPKGMVRGPRVIAGTLIFTVFDRHVLKQVMDTYKAQPNSFATSYGMVKADGTIDAAVIQDLRDYAKTDEMPPFDINISFMNEYGQSATLTIYGIYIMSEGQTMSIEDMITENTMSYIAMDIDLMDYDVGATENYDF
jgi:hypothetical protein